MIQTIRAIYESGQLRLLDPVELAEGQQVSIAILSDREAVRSALGSLLISVDTSADKSVAEDALMREIEAGFRGQPPLSEAIIEERREGP